MTLQGLRAFSRRIWLSSVLIRSVFSVPLWFNLEFANRFPQYGIFGVDAAPALGR